MPLHTTQTDQLLKLKKKKHTISQDAGKRLRKWNLRAPRHQTNGGQKRAISVRGLGVGWVSNRKTRLDTCATD